MKYSVAAAAALAATVSAQTIGDGVPLIYAPEPYPNPPYLGKQYNATVIRGIPLNSSNEWPCLTAEKYYSIPPPCAKECLIKTFAATSLCDDNDFNCHCSATGSAELDKTVIPCLGQESTCTGAEIGQLANFVHASLCPYFTVVSHEEAYGWCDADGSWEPEYAAPPKVPENPTWPKPAPSSSAAWVKPAEPCTTSVEPVWTKVCAEPTTFWVGTKTWEITKPTILTVTDHPITWTKPISSGTWAPISWTTAAPIKPVVESAKWTASAAPVVPAIESAKWSVPAAPAVPAVESAKSVASATPATVAGGYAKGTASWSAGPVQFTGAASSNKVAGAVAAVAAGAALLI